LFDPQAIKGLNLMIFHVRDIDGHIFGRFDYPVEPQINGSIRVPDKNGGWYNLPIVSLEIYPTEAHIPPIVYVDAVLLKKVGEI
jgi:hypothetical protein